MHGSTNLTHVNTRYHRYLLDNGTDLADDSNDTIIFFFAKRKHLSTGVRIPFNPLQAHKWICSMTKVAETQYINTHANINIMLLTLSTKTN